MAFILTSNDIQPGGTIPPRFTCDGLDISPALQWTGVPDGTQSFVLLLQDPDAPGGLFTHWVFYNLPASCTSLPENVPTTARAEGGLQGENDFHRIGYGGPCPPAGQDHRYVFVLHALDGQLDLPPGVPAGQVRDALDNHILGTARLEANYAREQQP